MLNECTDSRADQQLSALVSIQRDINDLLDRLDKTGLCLAAAHMSMSAKLVDMWIEEASDTT